MDNVYGTYASDALTLTNLRARRTGVQHGHNIRPCDPGPEEPVAIHVTTTGADAFEQAALYYTVDGSAPRGSRGAAENGLVVPLQRCGSEWDVAIWGYVIHWEAAIPGQADGTLVQYSISAWTADGQEIYADWPHGDETVHHAVAVHYRTAPADAPLVQTDHFPGQRIFNYVVDTLTPPAWAHGAAIYHIFVDRFYPGDGCKWIRPRAEDKVCGGTLWGVRDKLDYLADLGIDAVWLSPTWESPTFHGYDIADYRRTNARLGGDEALRAVIDGAHARGIRVLLDLACNHLSNQHPLFVQARADETSPYRDWFMFDPRLPNGYKSFFGVETMPRLNLDYPPARAWMIENACYWVQNFDIDGYRLDVADGPGPNFWTHMRRALRSVKSDCLIFGEIVDTPPRLRAYAGRLDGCLDFPLNDALRRTFGWETMTRVQLDAFVADNAEFYPREFLLPAFLDNHDMDRFMYAAGNDPQKLRAAAAYLFSLPNPVVIYNGTEIGMAQPISNAESGGYRACREPMIWDERQNVEMLDFFRKELWARRTRRRASAPGSA